MSFFKTDSYTFFNVNGSMEISNENSSEMFTTRGMHCTNTDVSTRFAFVLKFMWSWKAAKECVSPFCLIATLFYIFRWRNICMFWSFSEIARKIDRSVGWSFGVSTQWNMHWPNKMKFADKIYLSSDSYAMNREFQSHFISISNTLSMGAIEDNRI